MGFTGITIYYFNTKVKVSQKSEMSEYVKSMGINEIPAILEVNKGFDVRSEEKNLCTCWRGRIHGER